MFAGEKIDIVVPPGVLGDGGLNVGTVPLGVLIDVFDQRAETDCAVGIGADIQTVSGQRIVQQTDLCFGRPHIGLLHIVQIERRRNGRERDQNDDHHDDFNQGEP